MVDDSMHWASAISKQPDLDAALNECIESIRRQMGRRPIDLLFVFACASFAVIADEWLARLAAGLPSKLQIGCSGGGIIGAGLEVEGVAALSLMAGYLPGVALRSFVLTTEEVPDLDSSPAVWENLVGIRAGADPHFVLLPDGGSFAIDTLLSGLDFAFPASVKVGGLASGGSRRSTNRLFLGEQCTNRGLVGLALAGNLKVEAIVAQGCRPVGPVCRVTSAQGNMLWELDGKPALQVLQTIVQDLDSRDRELARNSLFVGVLINEFNVTAEHGDFLIRNLMGVEPKEGGIAVGEWLRTGQTVRFHLRDARTSREDLRLVLQRHRLEHEGARPAAALMFSCLGRGEYLYDEPNVDCRIFAEVLGGPVPIAGFFCNGEIGPVGRTSFVHGYTSSFGLFRPKERS